MSALKTAEQHATHDLIAVKDFRLELSKHHPVFKPRLDITAKPSQVAAERERLEYAIRQSSVVASLSTYEPLYTLRMQLVRPKDQIRVYFSPIGIEFTPVTTEDGDDILVSWAHPGFLSIRNLALGSSARISRGQTVKWTLDCKTEVGHEDRDVALFDLKVITPGGDETVFRVVRFENGRPIAIIETDDQEPAVEDSFAGDTITLPIDGQAMPVDKAYDSLLTEQPLLLLDTIVQKDGRAIAIPFALDELQWESLRQYSADGTLLLTGPPGTGKSTIALLRATTLIHSTYDYDDDGKRSSDSPKVDLRKQRFRVFVVTDHLKTYLKEFLSSQEVGLPDAQVVNLRGSFLENFIRHKTLATWIRGLRFRLSKSKNRLSDALIYIKSLPETLHLCFYHAVLNAQEHAGKDSEALIQRVFERVYQAIEDAALERVLSDEAREQLRSEELQHEVDLDEYLVRHRQKEAYDRYVEPRIADVRQSLAQLRDFVNGWLRAAETRCDQALSASQETWLVPGADDLLLSRFVESVGGFHNRVRERSLFIREAWRELVHLVDPKEVLLRVISDFEHTGDLQSLRSAGLSQEDALRALLEWRSVLEGTGNIEIDDEDGLEEADADTLDDLEGADIENEMTDVSRRKGSLTRTDFPLLAAVARVFLATPPESKLSPETYRGVGFLLPDDLARYDHVIIDEGQDFTYAEIHLVCSLVENERQAVTVSGDSFQRMDWRSGFSSLETIPVVPERRFHITKNYRQTIELSDWMRHLSKSLYDDKSLVIESAHEHGPDPTVIVEPSLAKSVKKAAESFREWYSGNRNPFATLLLVGFNEGVMTKITNALSDELEVDAIHAEKVQDGRQIERGPIAVASVPTVKGLQFDGVVIMVNKETCQMLESDSPQAKIAKNMVFVACSRAKRHLTLILQQEIETFRKNGVY